MNPAEPRAERPGKKRRVLFEVDEDEYTFEREALDVVRAVVVGGGGGVGGEGEVREGDGGRLCARAVSSIGLRGALRAGFTMFSAILVLGMSADLVTELAEGYSGLGVATAVLTLLTVPAM